MVNQFHCTPFFNQAPCSLSQQRSCPAKTSVLGHSHHLLPLLLYILLNEAGENHKTTLIGPTTNLLHNFNWTLTMAKQSIYNSLINSLSHIPQQFFQTFSSFFNLPWLPLPLLSQLRAMLHILLKKLNPVAMCSLFTLSYYYLYAFCHYLLLPVSHNEVAFPLAMANPSTCTNDLNPSCFFFKFQF